MSCKAIALRPDRFVNGPFQFDPNGFHPTNELALLLGRARFEEADRKLL